MKKLLLILLFCSVALSEDKPYRILNSFNSGELAAILSAREDLSKYQSGCSLMENLFPLPQGGAQKRPGTKYIATAKDSNYPVLLIPFEYSTEQSYIIECGNEYMRFFTDGAPVMGGVGTEDISALSNILAHWKLNDDAATTVVVDADGATYNGVASSNTEDINAVGKVNSCFDFNGVEYVTVADNPNFSFGNGTTDTPFSIATWVYYNGATNGQMIISKYEVTTPNLMEWYFQIDTAKRAVLLLAHKDNTAYIAVASSALSAGWYFIVATYDGSESETGLHIYINGVDDSATQTESGTYVAMSNTTTNVLIGSYLSGGVKIGNFSDKIDNLAMFSDELAASEVTDLYNTGVYEITSPYEDNEPFDIRYTQSADVLFLAHPNYAPRKLSRYANNNWKLDKIEFQKGPFLDENTTDTNIAPSATTGNITLTASTPIFSAGNVGGLWRLTYTDEAEEVTGTFTGADQNSTTVNMYLGRDYKFTTNGTWTGTCLLQRSYDNGTTWKDVDGSVVNSLAAGGSNIAFSGTEEEDDALYRVYMKTYTSTPTYSLVALSYDIEGVVEITSYTNATTVLATVKNTLGDYGDSNATTHWSEGAWSSKRGYPKVITFFEERLYFGNNSYKPDTIWGSVVGDYNNMQAGTEDDDAVVFTLASKQVNAIQWLVGKDKLLIGTSGAEWTLSGGTDEPITPSNVKAEQQSVYGSANLKATLANESVLFFQRGAKKMRELAYNWELDSYVAPDMTILAKEVTGDGIVDMDFQQIPDSILWCVRDDGEMPTFAYERKEEITSWARQITDGKFESVAHIHGDTEDETWVSVKRTIDSNDYRYIEQFQPRQFDGDANAFFVDCGATYTTDVNVITDLDWLEGESVFVLADGNILEANSVSHTLFVVSSRGKVTLGGVYQKVHIGLPYTVQLKTMPLSWLAQGMTIQGRVKRINGTIARWYESGDFYVGKDTTDKELYSIDGMTTDESRLKTFPAGYNQSGQVFVYQYSPEPLTLLALMIEFMTY